MEPHALVQVSFASTPKPRTPGSDERLTLTSDKWPVYILSGVTLSELQSLAVRSLLAVAKYTPIGPHSTSQTGSRPWPR